MPLENNLNPIDPSKLLRSFDVVIKVVERCNLACPYCYYFYQEYKGDKNPPRIKDEVIAALPAFLSRSVKELRLDRVNIAFHGGEPTLMSKKSFARLCEGIRSELDGKVQLILGMQTNGTLIDDDWIEMFSKYDVHVGVSIDGPAHIHDEARPDRSGNGSYDKTLAGLRRIQDAASTGRMRGCGAIAVWHKSPGSIEQLDHLIQDVGVSSPNFNVPRGGSDEAYAIEWDEHVKNHRSLMRHYLNNYTHPKFHYVRGLSETFLALVSDKSARWNDMRIVRHHYIATVSSGGKLLVDDNILGIDEAAENSDLTIFQHSLQDLVRSNYWQNLSRAIDEQPQDCVGCQWYRSCRGGFLYNRFTAKDGYRSKSVICGTIKAMHEEAFDFIVRNNIAKPEDLMARMHAPPSITAWQQSFQEEWVEPEQAVEEESCTRETLITTSERGG